MDVNRLCARMAARGLKVGRIGRIKDYASRNKIIRSRDLLTPMKAAWFIYMYGCAPMLPRNFKNWSLDKISYFNKLAQIGEINPVQAIAEFLKDPAGASIIRDLAIDRNTGAVAVITKDLRFELLTPYVDTLPDSANGVELIIFPNSLLLDIAEIIRDAQRSEKEKFLN